METPAPDALPESPVPPVEVTPVAVAPPVEAAPIVEAAPVEAAPVVAEIAPVPIVAPVEPPSNSLFGVGPTLRAAREKMGKSLAECSLQLRIRQPFLEALEEGRHRDLPGGTYAAGFLRTYSEYLDLDGEELVRRFRDEGAGGFTARAELSFPSPVSEGRVPGGAVIFLGVLLAAVAYGGWYMLSARESKVAEMVPPLPDRLSSILSRQASLTGDAKAPAGPSDDIRPGDEPTAAKVKDDVIPPAEGEDDKAPAPQSMVAPVEQTSLPTAKIEPVKIEPVKTEPVKTEPVKVEPPKAEPAKAEPPKAEPAKAEPPKAEPAKVEPPKVEPVKVEPPKAEPAKVEPPKAEPVKVEPLKVEPAKVETAADGQGKVFGAEFTDSRVVLRAAGDDCWVQVREMDGSLLMSRLLRRGDSYRVPNRPGLSLMVGNAGSLEVSVDGRKSPALGAVGQVRRDIRLDPDKLLAGG